jgi:hypothetical protein
MGWLAGVFTDQCSVDVSVTQDALTATVPATLGRSDLRDATRGSGIIDRWESRDFLIEHAEWIAAGFSALPQARGHDRLRRSDLRGAGPGARRPGLHLGPRPPRACGCTASSRGRDGGDITLEEFADAGRRPRPREP